MKITNLKLMDALNTLSRVSVGELPIKVAYGLKKNIDIISKELETFEGLRKELIEKYGDRDEEGNLKIKDGQYVVTNMEDFTKEYSELQNIENDIEFYDMDLNALLNLDINISLRELNNIDFLLK